jgi:CubicO group peptidase (beta-lactamase class C family)
MTRWLLASVALVAACSSPAPPAPKPAASTSTSPDVQRIHPYVQHVFDDLRLTPGMAVAVVHDSRIVYLHGFGRTRAEDGPPVTPETGFYIASSTKSFVGLAAALLAARGELDLDAPITRYLPTLSSSITLRSLLTHQSRLRNPPVVLRTAFTGEYTREVLLDLLSTASRQGPEGFHYDNIGYVVTGLAIESLGRGTWREVVAREVFEPLGMRGTTTYISRVPAAVLAQPHELAPSGAFTVAPSKTDETMHAAGGIVASASDLARWLQANLDRGRLDGKQVLPERAFAEAHRKAANVDERFFDFHRTGYGLGWYESDYEGDLLLHHFGSFAGFRSHISFMPDKRIGVAVLVNEGSAAFYLPDVVASYVYDRLLGKTDLDAKFAKLEANLRDRKRKPDDAVRAAAPARPWSSYEGAYENRLLGHLEIRSSGSGAVVRMGVTTDALQPLAAPDTFRTKLGPGDGKIEVVDVGTPQQAVRYLGETFKRIER